MVVIVRNLNSIVRRILYFLVKLFASSLSAIANPLYYPSAWPGYTGYPGYSGGWYGVPPALTIPQVLPTNPITLQPPLVVPASQPLAITSLNQPSPSFQITLSGDIMRQLKILLDSVGRPIGTHTPIVSHVPLIQQVSLPQIKGRREDEYNLSDDESDVSPSRSTSIRLRGQEIGCCIL